MGSEVPHGHTTDDDRNGPLREAPLDDCRPHHVLILLALSNAEQRGDWLSLPSLTTSLTEHLRRYLLAAATLGLAVWIAANLQGITG